jgi:hypothetical protein
MDDFKARFGAAKAHRREFIEDAGREAYRFCFNGREWEWDDRVKQDREGSEIFTDVIATVAEEFSGELFSTMTPENAPWAEFEAAVAVQEDQSVEVQGQIEAYEKAIEKALRGSNYYDEGHSAFLDAVVGNVAMWVERPTLSSPLSCRAIPISKLFLRVGPRGLEDRFYRERYACYDLPALLPDADFPRDMQRKIKDSPSAKVNVVWGFWRDYSDPSAPVWVQDIRVDEKPVGLNARLGGEGSCPLIVGRFNAVPGSAWGRGPAIRMQPTIRVLDEITRMNLEGMDRNLDPAFVYPHDGMLDLSDGIEGGIGYPAMPGTADSIQPLGLFGNLDYGFFSEERLREVIRDGFYRDVTQRGKTPPSASQYLGEEQKQVRRMARPAAKLWREFGIGLLKRVEYLEQEPGGALMDMELPLIASGVVTVRPISPLERATAREDVLVAQSIMGMTMEGVGPEQAALLIDGPRTFRNVKSTLKDKIVEFRSEEQIMQMMQMMQQQQATPQGAV